MSVTGVLSKAWNACQQRSFSITSSKDIITPAWKPYESTHGTKLQSIPECQAVVRLMDFVKNQAGSNPSRSAGVRMADADNYVHTLNPSQHRLALDGALATFSLHVHARIASLVGKGFYTIGPCGEELLSAGAMALLPQDSTALHYRHTAMSVARQLSPQEGTSNKKSLEEIVLARARGYTVSRQDPVTGGVHCSIGGGPNEYVVTSTLSSQCPPAVGRALGYALQQSAGINSASKDGMIMDRSSKPVSFVTIGDGSLHNHHFLSAFTLARHAKHLNIKCPLVMGISNNGLSISYETKNYVDTVFGGNSTAMTSHHDPLIPVFRANGQDMQSIYDQTQQAMDYARYYSSPCVLLFTNIVRRFGHAATDRQSAYLDETTIQAMAETCVLQGAIQSAVEQWNITTYSEVLDRLEEIHFIITDRAFAQAMEEPKVTLEDMTAKVFAPLAPMPLSSAVPPTESFPPSSHQDSHPSQGKPQVMRKHMTRFCDEVLGSDPTIVYLGEDVRHGGYYLVTEGLAEKYPTRVLDFPPDETTLLGAALGFSQLGLTPIVEIPYAKYLDCGVDMFYEIAIQHWLTPPAATTSTTTSSSATSSSSGMVIRLQGFDRGLFGGNFHTHNMLSHIPPGVDVVCYSNGKDYVEGMRYAIHQAKHGKRIVVVVDCTHLLNLRHIDNDRKDRQWEFVYPPANSVLTWDEIRRYHEDDEEEDGKSTDDDKEAKRNMADAAIVTYGNGVVTALQARQELIHQGWIGKASELDIIDCPYLSSVPAGLANVLLDYDKVLFADICKEGPGSNIFSSMITQLQQQKKLPSQWRFCGAPRTYNPLGSTVTFLNCDTIVTAFRDLVSDGKQG